ncbi:hypothetical protein Hanom_Chr12g01172631 [Helianthus anomalus]
MEGSESEAIFDSYNLNPQLFINAALNIVDELIDSAFGYLHQVWIISEICFDQLANRLI